MTNTRPEDKERESAVVAGDAGLESQGERACPPIQPRARQSYVGYRPTSLPPAGLSIDARAASTVAGVTGPFDGYG